MGLSKLSAALLARPARRKQSKSDTVRRRDAASLTLRQAVISRV